MTDQELLGLARQGLNMAATEVEQRRKLGMLLANYFEGEGVHRMRKVEDYLAQILGEDWLNYPRKKDAVGDVLRKAIELFPKPPDAFIMVSATNMFKPTAKLMAMPMEEQRKLMNEGHDAHHRMAAEGLLTVIDSYTATVQTPERVCVCAQAVDKRGKLVGQPEARYLEQEDFGGRFKMYGEDRFETERTQA
jgi:hypothetical protein